MKFSTGLIASIATIGFKIVSGAPLAVRGTTDITDGDILNYALTLEHLENAFYYQGLKNFTQEDFLAAGFSTEFYANLLIISSDEATHVDVLQKALSAGGTPVKPCTYAFPVQTVEDFVTVSGILEGVGVSAYLGAAASIMEKLYLTEAASILTVEARHSSYIRAANKLAPFAQPFDTPLTFNEVFSLAVQFITSCPSDNPPLPFKAFPVLALDVSEGSPEVKTGSTIQLSSVGVNSSNYQCIYAAFITVLGPIFVDVQVTGSDFEVIVPEGINGQSYVVLTSSNIEVTDDTTIAGPAIIEITSS